MAKSEWDGEGSGRRKFLQGAMGAMAGMVIAPGVLGPTGRGSSWNHGDWESAICTAEDVSAVRSEIDRRHEEAVKRLQTWIHQPSIAAENRGMNEGNQLLIEMLRDAGFDTAVKVPTDGQP